MTVPALAKQVADMESDIQTTIKVFADMMKALGIDPSKFDKGVDLMSILPGLMGNITTKLAVGSLDTRAFANVSAITPIFEKYKYLTENLENEQ